MIWVNHYKDLNTAWVSFSTIEDAQRYIDRRGGIFTTREGEQFDPAWINEVHDWRNESEPLS